MAAALIIDQGVGHTVGLLAAFLKTSAAALIAREGAAAE